MADWNPVIANQRIGKVIKKTSLSLHARLSKSYNCDLYLKREDQQVVRSYKIRGAFNKISALCTEKVVSGVVCASAGNHAQGVAYSCKHLNIAAVIFMPLDTPFQKINQVKLFGSDNIQIVLEGDNYDECAAKASTYSLEHKLPLIPPFDDMHIIEGQATLGLEILEELQNVDYLFIPIGGGGLAAGVGKYFSEYSPNTILIGVESIGAASMQAAFNAGRPVPLEKIDVFVDGTAVKQVGELTYTICKETIHHLVQVPEGKVCSTLLSLYNVDGIIAEPAGALSIAALDDFAEEIKGKKVVCILSGSNNDSNRMEDIKKLADEWEGLQHHLVIRLHHNPDGLKELFGEILGEHDYVNRIEYIRRDHGRSTYAMIGLRSRNKSEYMAMEQRMKEKKIEYWPVTKEDFLFKYWV